MKIAVIGAGGQARVISEILQSSKSDEILAYIDKPNDMVSEQIGGVPVIGKSVGDPDVIAGLIKNGLEGFIVAVGDNLLRSTLFKNCRNLGLIPVNAIHPTANIASNVNIGIGNVLAIGTTICSQARIGNNCIINSGSIIEHECIIEDHVHIASGTILAGRTTIRKAAFIGAGSVVKERTMIGQNAIVGAGSVVLEDVPDNCVVVGSPAKFLRNFPF